MALAQSSVDVPYRMVDEEGIQERRISVTALAALGEALNALDPNKPYEPISQVCYFFDSKLFLCVLLY
jgi:hypothetical protein